MLQEESTLTDRFQTTIPAAIRRVLNLKKRDKLYYAIEEDGRVTLSPSPISESDPVVDAFLHFLKADMVANPASLSPIPKDLLDRANKLVADMDEDLDAPLLDEDE